MRIQDLAVSAGIIAGAIFGPVHAQAWDGSGGGGAGGTLPYVREQIDDRKSARLAGRMGSLGYDKWIRLNGVHRLTRGAARFKAVVFMSATSRVDDNLPRTNNIEAYMSKIALMASDIFGIPVSELRLTVDNVACTSRFYDGHFMDVGDCITRQDSDKPAIGTVTNIKGKLPDGVGMGEAADRMAAYLRSLGATVSTTVSDGVVLLKATGLKGAVAKDLDRRESVSLYLVRRIRDVTVATRKKTGDAPWPVVETVETINYGPEYYLVADGSYVPVAEDGVRDMASVPFEPGRAKELDAFARTVKAEADTPSKRH